MKGNGIIFIGVLWVLMQFILVDVYGYQAENETVNRSPVWSFYNPNQERGFYMVASANIEPEDDTHELLVNEPFYNNGAGRVYFFSDLIDSIPDIIFTNPRGKDAQTLFGVSISIGDIDRDGLLDLLVGERTRSNAFKPQYSGQAYIYFGRKKGKIFDTKPDLTLTNPGIDIEGYGDNFGDHVLVIDSNESVFINGTSIRFFVTAREQDSGKEGQHSYGAVYAYDEGGHLVWTIHGKKGEYLGKWLEVADIDGNGSADLLVGGARTTQEEPPETGGVVQVWLSDQNGSLHTTNPSFYLPHPEDVIQSGKVNMNFGYKITAGDLNGDGVSDLIISDPYADNYNSAVYLYEGPVVSNDRPEWILRGIKNEELNELPKLRGLDFGDLNRDGIADLIVGAPSRALWSKNARVYLIYGGELSELPGTGTNPKKAYVTNILHSIGAPGFGNLGEHGLIAPLINSKNNQLNIATGVLASGNKSNLKVFVFSPDFE